ncbi:histidine phosphatase family protein [Roseburia sp. MUC/MUC-530-WT-4D]|uniref:Histidine phosphatase family protein n=1 Tax=Roseburia porci TaxID=2605790 RepID=A0A6L5YT65_9FIRM|nr:histidine phosphatase family protein [Roseburia porci]MST75650.1 histidine phosphatase family protein [Roseburia porci]
MKLYIIRHGETSWNKEKKLQGQRDIMLNENGLRLAELTGEGMKDIEFDLVISSPLIRAKQTAELVMAGRQLPMITDKRIIEMSFGKWEGECVNNSEVLPSDYKDKFYNDPLHCPKAPGGESFQDVLKRTADFYQSLVHNKAYENAAILISTHGAASRCLLANFYEDKEDIWRGGVPKNCSVCIVDVKDGVGTVLEKDKVYYPKEA